MSAVGSDEMAHPLAERKGNVISRRSTRIETKVRQSALMDRVAKSVKRELKTLGLELKAWQVPEQKAEAVRKQRDCVLHFTTAQQRQRERAAAKATASAAASVLAKRLQNQSPCRPAIKLTRVHALSNIALQKVRRTSGHRNRAAAAPSFQCRRRAECLPCGAWPENRPLPVYSVSRRECSEWCTSNSSSLPGSARS